MYERSYLRQKVVRGGRPLSNFPRSGERSYGIAAQMDDVTTIKNPAAS